MENASTGETCIAPDAERVAARAIALAAVACRGMIECDDDKHRAEDHHRELCDWIDCVGLGHELEPSEDLLIRIPVGQLDQQSAIDAAWRAEGMLVLAWSLGRVPLPSYDEQWDSFDVARKLGFLSERSATALAGPSLRARAEIVHAANTYLTLHWRLREYSVSRARIDFASYVSQCTWGPLTLSELSIIDGDLGIRGERIDQVHEDRYQRTLSSVRERHRAFNWLIGFGPIYSDVGTAT